MGEPDKCDHKNFELAGKMSGESGMLPDCLVEKALRLLAADADYVELVRAHKVFKDHVFKPRIE
jgi:hypothetical protein